MAIQYPANKDNQFGLVHDVVITDRLAVRSTLHYISSASRIGLGRVGLYVAYTHSITIICL